jgi:hypothetical protein
LGVLGAREGTVGHEGGRAVGGLEWRDVFGDDLAAVLCVEALATVGCHEPGHPRLMCHEEVEHDWVEIRAMVAAVATGTVNHRRLRCLRTVVATIDMDAGAIQMGTRRRQPEALRQCRDPIVIERLQGTSERLSWRCWPSTPGVMRRGVGLF